jgi:hypothetical protein
MGKVLHASKSGYFPFCITEVGSITEGFRGTIKQMMAIYWRVKKWEIAVSGSGLLYQTPISFNNISYELVPAFQQTTEEQLVCSSGFFFSTNIVAITLPDAIFTLPLTGIFQLQFSGATKSDNTYSLSGRAVVDGDGYDGIRTNSGGGSVVGAWSVRFLGGSITGNLYSQTNGSWDGSGGIIMTISATEYWSYGGTYDTSTGESL